MREIKNTQIEEFIRNALINEDGSVVEILCGNNEKVFIQRLVSVFSE